MIWAHTAIAISSGVCAVTSIPIGQITLSSDVSDIPESRAASVNDFHFARLPIVPRMNDASMEPDSRPERSPRSRA